MEISFKGEIDGINQKFIESQRQLSLITQNKQELHNMMEKIQTDFDKEINLKNQEIEFLKNNQQIKENKNLISDQKLEEIKSRGPF